MTTDTNDGPNATGTLDPPTPGAGPIEEMAADLADRFDRRSLLRASWKRIAALGGGGAALAACDLVSSPFDRTRHLLNRLTFGVTRSARDDLNAMGEQAWLAGQLNPGSLDTSAVDAKLASLPALGLNSLQLLQTYPTTADSELANAQLKLAFLIRAVESPAQLQERIVEFWSDHFNVPAEGRFLNLMKIVEDRDHIRPNALGRFKDLLVASAQSATMLDYLDNARSEVGAINENYARELLELHTLGVNGGYTEDDIVATARLLTGWDYIAGAFFFRVNNHDTGALQIMDWVRPSGTDYVDHGVQFLHWLADHPSTRQFVCTKLARRFVSEQPDPGLIDAMTAAWAANDTQIGAVIQAMIAHPSFDAAAGTKFTRPLDYIARILRVLGADITPTTDINQLVGFGRALAALGQVPFEWPAPNGYPDAEGAWLNTGAMLNRWNLVGDVLANTYGIIGFDPTPFVQSLQGLTAEAIYDETADLALAQPMTDTGVTLLTSQTGWDPTHTPSAAEISAGLPTVAFALLTSTDALYR